LLPLGDLAVIELVANVVVKGLLELLCGDDVLTNPGKNVIGQDLDPEGSLRRQDRQAPAGEL